MVFLIMPPDYRPHVRAVCESSFVRRAMGENNREMPGKMRGAARVDRQVDRQSAVTGEDLARAWSVSRTSAVR